ncbi:hypothetical protein FRX31_010860 [Thalictrum thalictroides]|uniref:F-box domain-containing protein n=1 Tax=Thalictrum thalictroides TaxID=46969 RepID=A0A7J6WRL6_THATH|nr:hypothetical protein FRX31_010860 [Thalictrum thalictroides]
MAVAGWSELPKDLLQQIVGKLSLCDHLGFTSVCSSWRSVGVENRRNLSGRFLGLIVPGETKDSEMQRLLEPLQCNYTNNSTPPNIPIAVPHGHYCCGSSLGWLVLIDDSLNMQLFNPLSGMKFQLPSAKSLAASSSRGFERFGKYNVDKVVISDDPCSLTSLQTVVLLIYGRWQIAISKPGDKAWTPVDYDVSREYQDAIYFKGRFYVVYNLVHHNGGVVTCDIADIDHPKLSAYAPKPPGEIFHMTRYLVESKGELFQIKRYIKFDSEPDNETFDSDSDADEDSDINDEDGDGAEIENNSVGHEIGNDIGDKVEADNIDNENGGDNGVEVEDDKKDNENGGDDVHKAKDGNVDNENGSDGGDEVEDDNNDNEYVGDDGDKAEDGNVDNENGGDNRDEVEDDNVNNDNSDVNAQNCQKHEVDWDDLRRYNKKFLKLERKKLENPMAGGWSELPKDMLQQIFSRLLLPDHYGFSSVCSSWRSVALLNRGNRFLGLIVPGETKDSETRRLFDPLQCDSVNNKNPPKVPVPHKHYCCGSSFGWLVLVDDCFDMHLFNPLSGAKLPLPSSATLPPPLPTFRSFSKYYVDKALLSCDPFNPNSSQNLVVFVICGSHRRLAFCKLGDKLWSPITSISRRDYVDAIFYEQKFYAIYNPGGLVSCDVSNTHPRVIDYARRPRGEVFWHTRYLVECRGKLFQLRRNIQFDLDDEPYESDSDYDDDYDYDYHVNNIDYGDYSEDGKVDSQNGDNIGDLGDKSDHGVVNNYTGDMNDQCEVVSDRVEVDNHTDHKDDQNEESVYGVVDDNLKADNNDQCNESDHGKVHNHNGNNNNQSDHGEDDERIGDNDDQSDDSAHSENDDNHIGNNDEQSDQEEVVSQNDDNDGQNDDDIDRVESMRRYKTIGFKIFKLTESNQCRQCSKPCYTWEKVEGLGDNAFFVGFSSSFSVSALDFFGCKSNSVYFTESRTPFEDIAEPIRHDLGIYNVQEKSVEAVYPIDSKPTRPPAIFWPTPIPW